MKKLMIALAVAAMAVVANAATAKWTANNLYQPGSTSDKASGYIGYFIESATLSRADAIAILSGDDDSTKLATLEGYFKTGSAATSSTAGVLSSGNFGNYGNSETVTGYAVIFNNSDAANATLAYVTAEASKATGASGQAATLAIGKLEGSGASPDSRVAGNWYAVPEPTSGLLMLLGMAGLALRRRRA